MDHRVVSKEFRLVGLKSKGPYSEFGSLVPNLARVVWSRSEEMSFSFGKEIAAFEPKKGPDHQEGEFYVGLLVDGHADNPLHDMTFAEFGARYATTRGQMEALQHLHDELLEWISQHDYKTDLDEYIVEVYHPSETGEEVEIFLPVREKAAGN